MKTNSFNVLCHAALLPKGKSSAIIVLLVIASFLSSISVQAQLVRFPVQRKNPSKSKSNINKSARKKAVPLPLPFWDDFSFTPVNDAALAHSNQPLVLYWYKSESVWINDGLGINEPTRNVASFDGLDSLGKPYSSETLANGFRDTLTSQPIDLSAVVGLDTNTVYLSFFFQWKGNGEPPDASDYLKLEFKTIDGDWEKAMQINTRKSFDPTVFYDTIVHVNGGRFFHNTFQFRFLNYGRESGPFDTWNIDYVYLNKGRTSIGKSFPDRAIASTISPLFKPYYAMPVKHFFAESNIDSVQFDIQNLKNGLNFVAIEYSLNAEFTNHIGASTYFYSDSLITHELIGDDVGNLDPYERITQQLDSLPDPTQTQQFNPLSDSIAIRLTIDLVSGDQNDLAKVLFAPIDFEVNDTLSATYFLDDYYAYDDGTAEYSAGLTNSGNQLAYQFTRPSSIPDSLTTIIGLDFYCPPFSWVSSLFTDFYVFDDDGGMPGIVLYSVPNYELKLSGVNAFQRIPINQPVGTTFYIGWKNPVEGTVVVGLDASNNTADKMFVFTNGSWAMNDAVEGSLMLRPVFGVAGDVTGIEDEVIEFSIFPNPNNGIFTIRGKYDRLEIISVTGQILTHTVQQNGDDSYLTINNPLAGLYLVKIMQGNTVITQKIMVR